MKINIWTRCVQDRVRWKEVVEEVNNEVVAPEEEEDKLRFSNNTDISLYSGCFIMPTYCVFCAVGTEFLYIVWMEFIFHDLAVTQDGQSPASHLRSQVSSCDIYDG